MLAGLAAVLLTFWPTSRGRNLYPRLRARQEPWRKPRPLGITFFYR